MSNACRRTRRSSAHHPSVTALVTLAAVASAWGAPSSATEVVEYVSLQMPTVVAFVPVSGEPAAAWPLDRADVAPALERARACLGSDGVSYRLVVVDRIVVQTNEGEESFEIASAHPLVGALLLRPDVQPRILFAGGGPQALRRMIRQAVADYFERACRR